MSQYSVKLTTIPLIFILTGAGVESRDLLKSLLQWKLHLYTQLFNLGFIPAVVFLAVTILKPILFYKAPPLADGVIIMACFPTTVGTCVVLTKMATGNEPAAIFNMVFGNVIGLIATPGLLLLMTSAKSFAPPTDILLNLCLTIVVPIIIGQLLRLKFAAQIDHFRLKIFSFGHINNIFLLTLFWATFCDTFSKDDIPVSWEVFLFTVLLIIGMHCGFLLLCFFGSAIPQLGFSKEDRIAVLVCATQKTITGIALMGIFFKGDPDLPIKGLPLLVYHPTQFIIASIYVIQLKKWNTKKEDDYTEMSLQIATEKLELEDSFKEKYEESQKALEEKEKEITQLKEEIESLKKQLNSNSVKSKEEN